MAPGNSNPKETPKGHAADESAAQVLRQLESARGRLFTDAEYVEYRRSVLEELAFGARVRPFTFFTFIVVELALAALLVVGLRTSAGKAWGDYGLALASFLAMICGGVFLWLVLRGVREDERRSLDDRLCELEEVRRANLITLEEYQYLQSQILHRRQRSARL